MPLMTLAWLCSALAAEVVWLDPEPTSADVARVAAIAGATRGPLDALALRYAATDRSDADAASWSALDASLREVRSYETRLDGELVIMRDLARPIAGISLLNSTSERDRLYAALVYQGFAVDRYFLDTLSQDERAADIRVSLPDGSSVPQPWLDAMAIDPSRVPTPYEMAEAPQRVRYAAAREKVLALLPGLLILESGLPAGASLWIDGTQVALDASGQVRLPPGRHLAHVARDGHVLARLSFRLDIAGTATLSFPLTDSAWDAWQLDLRDDGQVEVPAALLPAVRALGGEVVLAWHGGGHEVQAARLTAEGVSPLEIPKPGRSVDDSRDGGLHVQGALGVGGGWFQSDDFYLQSPGSVPHTVGSVNAGALNIAADVSLQVGLFRASVLGDIGVPFGADHVALTGDDSLRVRPDVSLGLGVRWVQVTGGFLFPYHPSVGARVAIPVWRGLEVLASGKAGLPVAAKRADDSVWKGAPVVSLWAGIGWRFDVATR